jgi:hypothetical protein
VRASPLTFAGVMIALLCLAVFAFFLLQGLNATRPCGIGCLRSTGEVTIGQGTSAFADYLYGVTALLLGQLAIVAMILIKRRT